MYRVHPLSFSRYSPSFKRSWPEKMAGATASTVTLSFLCLPPASTRLQPSVSLWTRLMIYLPGLSFSLSQLCVCVGERVLLFLEVWKCCGRNLIWKLERLPEKSKGGRGTLSSTPVRKAACEGDGCRYRGVEKEVVFDTIGIELANKAADCSSAGFSESNFDSWKTR